MEFTPLFACRGDVVFRDHFVRWGREGLRKCAIKGIDGNEQNCMYRLGPFAIRQGSLSPYLHDIKDGLDIVFFSF